MSEPTSEGPAPSRRTKRRAASLVGALLVVSGLTTAPTQADDVTPNVVLIGDSISDGQYFANDWSWPHVLAASTGLELRRYATPSSGIVKRGAGCGGGTYLSRLASIAKNHPSAVIIEDGIGDRFKCVKRKYVRIATLGEYRRLVEDFMHQLAVQVVAEGLARDRVFILTPTSLKVRKFDWTRKVIADAATRHGFTNVAPVYLAVNETTDGFHPNEAGHRRIATVLEQVLSRVRNLAPERTKPRGRADDDP